MDSPPRGCLVPAYLWRSLILPDLLHTSPTTVTGYIHGATPSVYPPDVLVLQLEALLPLEPLYQLLMPPPLRVELLLRAQLHLPQLKQSAADGSGIDTGKKTHAPRKIFWNTVQLGVIKMQMTGKRMLRTTENILNCNTVFMWHYKKNSLPAILPIILLQLVIIVFLLLT